MLAEAPRQGRGGADWRSARAENPQKPWRNAGAGRWVPPGGPEPPGPVLPPPPPFATPPPRETVTWPKKHRKNEAPKALKKNFLSVRLEFGGGGGGGIGRIGQCLALETRSASAKLLGHYILPYVLTLALSNTLPFLRSWGSFLLSVTAWMQLAVLSGYPQTAVRASATLAVHRVLTKTQWDVPLSTQWVAYISPRLPQSLQDTVCDVCDLLSWLQRCAMWRGSRYVSWHIAHQGPCTDFCGD